MGYSPMEIICVIGLGLPVRTVSIIAGFHPHRPDNLPVHPSKKGDTGQRIEKRNKNILCSFALVFAVTLKNGHVQRIVAHCFTENP
jgi:hypothetical protein